MDKQLLEELSEQLKKGDDSAITPIYHMTNKVIFSIALSILKDEHLAQDIMQDTYLKMRSSIDSYQSGTNFLAWLSQIARNFALMEYRKRKKEVLVDVTSNEYLMGSVSYDFKEQNPILSAALTILTKEEREVVFLHINNDLKHREISKVINKPLGTVLCIYNKAIKKLKDYFEKNGGVSNE